MMATFNQAIIISDPHIEERWFFELEDIFEEVLTYKASTLIISGDLLHRTRPTVREIEFASRWVSVFKKHFNEVILIRGNHDNIGDTSNIDFLIHWGINVVDDYVYEYCDTKFYFGHFMTNKSKFEYGEAKTTIKTLQQKYDKVILGHQHSFQQLFKNGYHIGSCRWVNYNEAEDKAKYIGFIDKKGQLNFKKLKSSIPMKQVHTIKELSNISPKTKVCITINDYNYFKQIVNELPKWENKFIEFKYRLNFQPTIDEKEELKEILEDKSLCNCINDFFETIEDTDVHKLLTKEFKQEQLI